MSAVVQPYQEIEDISIARFGTAEGIVALAKSNAQGIDAVLSSGQVLNVPSFTPPVSDKNLLKPYILPVVEDSNQVIVFQNLTDVAIQEYGSAEALVQLCKLNGLPLDEVVSPGTDLRIGNAVRPALKQYLFARNKKVNTGNDYGGEPLPGILTEDGFYILTEDGQNIIPE